MQSHNSPFSLRHYYGHFAIMKISVKFLLKSQETTLNYENAKYNFLENVIMKRTICCENRLYVAKS